MTGQIDTGTDELLATLQAGVLTLTMNRAEARNALTGKMSAALSAQLEDAELNADVRCVVLTGAGKGFCAGGDVKGMAARSDDAACGVSMCHRSAEQNGISSSLCSDTFAVAKYNHRCRFCSCRPLVQAALETSNRDEISTALRERCGGLGRVET